MQPKQTRKQSRFEKKRRKSKNKRHSLTRRCASKTIFRPLCLENTRGCKTVTTNDEVRMIYLQCSPPDDHPCYFYFFPPRWSGGLMSLSIRVEPTVFFLFFFLVLLLFFFSLFFFFHSPSTHAFIPSAALSRATDLWAQSTKLWLKAIYLNPQTLSRPRGHKFMNLLPELDFAICRQCLKTHTGNYGRQKWLFINSLDGLGRASVSAKHAGFSFFFFLSF